VSLHALKADRAGVLVHLGPIDLEPFAELDRGLGDQFFQVRFSLLERQLPQVVDLEQVEGDHHKAGSMKPGKGALTPIAGGFLRWNAITLLRHRTGIQAGQLRFVPKGDAEPSGHVLVLFACIGAAGQ
jgi:hypothetical protein